MKSFLESKPDPGIGWLITSQDKSHHRISSLFLSGKHKGKKSIKWLCRDILQNTKKEKKNYMDVTYSCSAMCSHSSGLRHANWKSNKLFLSLGSNKSACMTRLCFCSLTKKQREESVVTLLLYLCAKTSQFLFGKCSLPKKSKASWFEVI